VVSTGIGAYKFRRVAPETLFNCAEHANSRRCPAKESLAETRGRAVDVHENLLLARLL
jgi:hypothetical protein